MKMGTLPQKQRNSPGAVGHLAQELYRWCTTSSTFEGCSVPPPAIFTGSASTARNLEGVQESSVKC